jgi:hypothetical protein
MNRRKNQGIVMTLYLCLAVCIGALAAGEAVAGEGYKVSIGSSAWSMKNAYSNDLSREAIEDGQNNFAVAASPDNSFQIKLSEKQMDDLLAGSTVIVDTETGNQKVKIEPQMKKPAASGW